MKKRSFSPKDFLKNHSPIPKRAVSPEYNVNYSLVERRSPSAYIKNSRLLKSPRDRADSNADLQYDIKTTPLATKIVAFSKMTPRESHHNPIIDSNRLPFSPKKTVTLPSTRPKFHWVKKTNREKEKILLENKFFLDSIVNLYINKKK